MAYKSIIKIGTMSNIAGETLSEPTGVSDTIAQAQSLYTSMDVLVNLKTLTGTSPTMTYSVQERFSDAGFVETAKSSPISGTGKYILSKQGQTGQSTTSAIQYGFGVLGEGMNKQIISTAGGTVGTITADIFLIFY